MLSVVILILFPASGKCKYRQSTDAINVNSVNYEKDFKIFWIYFLRDLISAGKMYDDTQTILAHNLIEQSINEDSEYKAEQAINEGYKGIGVLEFISHLLNKEKL